MSSTTRCCVRCLVTRGPHAGASVIVCRYESTAATEATALLLLAVGRKKQCRLRLLRDLEVSSAHAELCLVSSSPEKQQEQQSGQAEETAGVMVRDVGSTNGSKLNGQPLTPRVDYALKDGDLLGFGRSSVRVRFVAHQSAESGAGRREDEAAEASTASAESAQSVIVAVNGDVDKKDAGDEPAAKRRNQNGDNDGEGELTRVQAVLLPSEDQIVVLAGDERGELTKQARRDDHDDADAFESPKWIIKRARNEAAADAGIASSRRVSCMVCGQWLGLLDVLEQQLHINACLDGRVAPVVEASASRTGRPKASKKRKRRGATGPEHEQLTLAMALSKSLAGEGQQADMQLALARQELGQIDAQMAKLAKRRTSLIKSMAKLEKKAAKLRKSRVRPPGEVRALLRLELALDAMFPSGRQAVDSAEQPQRKPVMKRRRWVYQLVQDEEDAAAPSQRLSCLSQPESEESADDDRVSMWVRASQNPSFDLRERQVYYNSVLLAFLPLESAGLESSEEQKSSEEAGQGVQDGYQGEEREPIAEQWMPAPDHEARDPEENLVPDVVKRAFPNWRQDLKFLRERSVQELREALEELVRAREDGHLALLTQSQVPVDGHEELLQDHEREEACAYMETVMRRLVDQKMQASDGQASSGDGSSREPPAGELLDDEGEEETEEEVRSDARRSDTTPGSYEIGMDGMEAEDSVDAGGRFSTRVAGGDDDAASVVYRSLSSSELSSLSSSDDEVDANAGSESGVLATPTQDAWTQEVATQAVIDTLPDAQSTLPLAPSSPGAGTSSDDDDMPRASDSSTEEKHSEAHAVDTHIPEPLLA